MRSESYWHEVAEKFELQRNELQEKLDSTRGRIAGVRNLVVDLNRALTRVAELEDEARKLESFEGIGSPCTAWEAVGILQDRVAELKSEAEKQRAQYPDWLRELVASHKCRPCPFCGGRAHMCHEVETWKPYSVHCLQCGAVGTSDNNPAVACEQWNTRMESSEPLGKGESIDWDEISKGDYSLPCPHPARNGRHETYCNTDGKEYCRACGRRSAKRGEGESDGR